jgi:hypothetical protein
LASLTISATAKGPAALALRDESELQAGGRVTQRLQERGLWLAADRYLEILVARQVLGERLCREIPLPFPTVAAAGASLNTAERRFRTRLPRRLSFGYEMSFGFHSFLTGREPLSQKAAILGAIFNLGIILFDHVCDNLTEGVRNPADFFDEKLLGRLDSSPHAHAELAKTAQCVVDPEVRSFLQTVSVFFARLECSARVPRDSEVRRTLNRLLVRAYRAQIRCSDVRRGGGQKSAFLLSAKEKSTLPFSVILQLIRVCDENARGVRDRSANRLVRQIARVFWLIDDLADLERDFRRGHANVILLRAGASRMSSSEATGGKTGPLALEDFIEEAIDQVCVDLAAAASSLRDANVKSSSGHAFDEVLLAYVRKWVERSQARQTGVKPSFPL